MTEQKQNPAPHDSQPPIAKRIPETLRCHEHERIDNYYWLRNREAREVTEYLEAENAYFENKMAPLEGLRELLYEEIKGRIKQDDETVPYRLDDYFYYTRTEADKAYAIHCRKRASLEAPEEVMLDGNALAQGHDYFALGAKSVSSNQRILAYAVDTQGRRIYCIHFKDLDTGEPLEDTIAEVTGNLAWANDNRTLFYAKQDPETLRSYQIYRHQLGADSKGDVLVYEEKDETFSAYVYKTKSKRFIMIACDQSVSSEYRFLDANQPQGKFNVFAARQRDHEYQLYHHEDTFYIRTNDQATNFRLMKTPIRKPGRDNWIDVIPARDDVLLGGVELFREHLVVQERKAGLTHIRVIPWGDQEEHSLKFDEPTYLAAVGTNPDPNTGVLRYGYTSMTTPTSVFDYDMVTREKTLLKQETVLGEFASTDYETERLFATATDGTRVPISIVYPKGFEKNNGNPLLLYAYGSYGLSTDATFSSARLSLLDRGFAFAIAHVRGGQDLGRPWYEDGKLLKKKNTFTDFIACGEFLIEEGYTATQHLYAMGGSAGGLLVGAVMNMRPELFNGIVAAVPFVDVVTTMLDTHIPLTTSEYDEWGDPNEQKYYDYILSYSPYDNVEAKDYPSLLVTTGLHDSQVQYWEPAKWIAKLRHLKTDRNQILLKTSMEAGHGGRSGRFEHYREIALNYAFMLNLENIEE